VGDIGALLAAAVIGRHGALGSQAA
jgi:hypothetical protein